MVDGKNFFDHPVKSTVRTYDNIWKTTTGQGDDYSTGCHYIISTLITTIELYK